MTGRVKYFSNEKGFGFIIPDEDGYEPIFVHQTEIQSRGYRSLAEDEKVEFEIRTQRDGRLKAFSVTGPNGEDCKGIPQDLKDTRDDGEDRRSRSPRRGRRDDRRESRRDDRREYRREDRYRDDRRDDRRGGRRDRY